MSIDPEYPELPGLVFVSTQDQKIVIRRTFSSAAVFLMIAGAFVMGICVIAYLLQQLAVWPAGIWSAVIIAILYFPATSRFAMLDLARRELVVKRRRVSFADLEQVRVFPMGGEPEFWLSPWVDQRDSAARVYELYVRVHGERIAIIHFRSERAAKTMERILTSIIFGDR